MSDVSHNWEEFLKRIADAKSSADVDALDQELFGRKAGVLTVALKEMGTLDPETRKRKAQELNAAKAKLTMALEEKHRTLNEPSGEALRDKDRLDVTLDLPRQEHGHLHLIPEFIREVEDIFGRMGFDVAYGPEVETEEYNFNKLNIPESHPARDAQDTFWVKDAKKTVLRTHTSPVQIRYMQEHKPPFQMICPGRVYRKDADATHSPMFHQWEGLMVGKDISLANMKAVMIAAITELIGKDVEFRFRTGYFPFVEPGLEVDVRWQGDESQSREGRWLEIVGCGMVHPKVLENGGIDPTKWQGFAFGFGVERMLMIRHRIPDLRMFYEGDVRFLRQF
jgi:phenylalanyl-tRNA synthetase alpha chain